MPKVSQPSRAEFQLVLNPDAKYKAPANVVLVIETCGTTEPSTEPTGKKVKRKHTREVPKVTLDPDTENEIRTVDLVEEEVEEDELREVPSEMIYEAKLGLVACRSPGSPEAAEKMLAAALRRLADQID